MVPPITTKRCGQHEQYLVRRYSRGGERRIMQGLAIALAIEQAPAPLLNSLDGDSRYWEEVFKECLIEAPEHWWEPAPPTPSHNGALHKRLCFEFVSVEEFNALSKEVQGWFDSFRQADNPPVLGAGAAEPSPVAAVETLPPAFRGVAS